MIRRPPRSTLSSSSAASDVYKRQFLYRVGHYSKGLKPPLCQFFAFGLPLSLYFGFPLPFPESRCDGLFLSLIHISEPTRLGMISYAVFCLKKKKQIIKKLYNN